MTIVPAVVRGETVKVRDLPDRLRAVGYEPATVAALWSTVAKLQTLGAVTTERGVMHVVSGYVTGTIKDGRIWGDPSIFQPQEIAHHRREAILQLMAKYQPVLRAELVDALEKTEWVRAPKVVSLIKADLEQMAKAGLVERTETEPYVYYWSLVQKGQGHLRLA